MIIALEEAKYNLENFRADLKELGSAIRIDELREKVAALEATTTAAEVWNDQENSGKVLKEIKRLKDKIEKYEALEAKLETLDAIHQENVRVYRNVQAVVVDETARVRKAVDAANASVKRKAVTSLVFSILSFSFTVLILIFLILDKVGLF